MTIRSGINGNKKTMTNDRIDSIGTNDSKHSEDNDQRLEAVVERLNARVAAFEQKLESAVLAESQFRENVQTLLNSLDAFVEKHVEKDRHLTQLIEEDTQRSKEAKEEYDALASRFDDNLRRENVTRTREWLRTVSVYVGIVVSVVLMAPFQALWWLLSRTLARMGLLRSSEETTIYSNVRRRRRDMTRKAALSNRPEAIVRHNPLTSTTSDAFSKENEPPIPLSSALDKTEATKDDANIPGSTSVKRGNRGKDQDAKTVSHRTALANTRSNGDNALKNDIGKAASNSRHRETTHKAESSESEDEFFDAQNGPEGYFPQSGVTQTPQINQVAQKEEKEVDDDDTSTRENALQRPGWAVPAGSDGPLPDLSAFPSEDFWEISDEDVRLEVQRSDHASC